MENKELISKRYQILSPLPDEKSRRLFVAAEATGRNGIAIVYSATKVSRTTISTGLKELSTSNGNTEKRIRNKGGGRKKSY